MRGVYGVGRGVGSVQTGSGAGSKGQSKQSLICKAQLFGLQPEKNVEYGGKQYDRIHFQKSLCGNNIENGRRLGMESS